MGRVYPPIWCETNDCCTCNLEECNRKILELFEPYRYSEIDLKRRIKHIEITTIAIYFGFCRRLAKFCLLFPQDAPIPVVRTKFINGTTGLPTNQSIQRIFLDMLSRGDPKAPTDEVHKYRLAFLSEMTGSKKGTLVTEENQVEIQYSKKEKEKIVRSAKVWVDELRSGKLRFDKTSKSELCRFCFLENCDSI